MKNNKRSGSSDFGKRKSRGSSFERREPRGRDAGRGDRNSAGRTMMFKAVCAECGDDCEVPFKPSGGRPVLCSNCFQGKDDHNFKRGGQRDFGRPKFNDRKMYRATCAECGEKCEVPFQPTAGKPVYCSECFGGSHKSGPINNDHGSGNRDNFKEQLEILNAKLDKILRAITFITPSEPTAKKEVVKEIKTPEVVEEPAKPAKKKTAKKTVKK